MRTQEVILYKDPGWLEVEKRFRAAQSRRHEVALLLKNAEGALNQELNRLAEKVIAGDAEFGVGRVPDLAARVQVLELAYEFADHELQRAQSSYRNGPPRSFVKVRELSDPPWVVT